jgi:hypothetical protein
VRDQRIDGIDSTLQRLFPGAAIVIKQLGPIEPPPALHIERASSGAVGIVSGKPEYRLWAQFKETGVWDIRITRQEVNLTEGEEKVFHLIPKAIAGLLFSAEQRREHLARRAASVLSLEHILIAQLLKRRGSATYWTPLSLLQLLIDLSFVDYEGAPASSGFVLTTKPEMYVKQLEGTDYVYECFASETYVNTSFFQTPASFRYVDARNAFYLVDQQLNTKGVLRPKDPKKFDIIARTAQQHVIPLVKSMPGKPWIGYVGYNRDVNVITHEGTPLKWERNHWFLKDQEIITQVLLAHGCNPETSLELTQALYAMSELRMGTVVLIPRTDSELPLAAGKIDSSAIGDALRLQMQGQSVPELRQRHLLIGVLSSDGLTTVSKTGQVISTGEIIDLTKGADVVGGGRTQAARAASVYGLAIKVSEDGPITIFRDGQQVLRM